MPTSADPRTRMQVVDAPILKNEAVQGGYYLLELEVPSISSHVKPGQFVHVRVSRHDELVLRRPFSVFKTSSKRISIVYKAIGKGTRALSLLTAGDTVSLLGPLGNGFPELQADHVPVLVAGGYGMAALYLVAERSAREGLVFVGGRSSEDILCRKDFEQLGWDVRVATEDGSLGEKGLVTDILDAWSGQTNNDNLEFFACGPLGMLQEVGYRAEQNGWRAWLSLDRNMGCGVGACLTCVQKIRTADGEWSWARVCRDGPVFEAREIVWED